MKHTLSKIALAMLLVHGSISVQHSSANGYTHNSANGYSSNDFSEDEYFDEDDSFLWTHHFQRETWHWGITKAYACGPNREHNSCVDDDDIEHIPVTGNPIDDPDYGGGFDNPADPINDNGSDGESGGGSSGGGGESNGKSEREECLDRVQNEALRCEEDAQTQYRNASNLCQQSAFDGDSSFEDVEYCYQTAESALNTYSQQCSDTLSDDTNHCNTYFSN